MFTLCGLAFAKERELYQIGLLFTHEKDDFCAISVTGRVDAVVCFVNGRCHF